MIRLRFIGTTNGFRVSGASPRHPRNSWPGSGVAFRVICSSRAKSFPTGDVATVPAPRIMTASELRPGGSGSNRANKLALARVTGSRTGFVVPVSSSPQYANPLPGSGTAVTLLPGELDGEFANYV